MPKWSWPHPVNPKVLQEDKLCLIHCWCDSLMSTCRSARSNGHEHCLPIVRWLCLTLTWIMPSIIIHQEPNHLNLLAFWACISQTIMRHTALITGKNRVFHRGIFTLKSQNLLKMKTMYKLKHCCIVVFQYVANEWWCTLELVNHGFSLTRRGLWRHRLEQQTCQP